MTAFKAVLVLTSAVVASLAFTIEELYESDSINLLQTTYEEKLAVKKASQSLDEPASDYNLPNSLACESKAVEAPVVAALIEPTDSTVIHENHPISAHLSLELAGLEGEDPPGASALRALLQLMIVAVFFDGLRRWRLQRQQRARPNHKVVKNTPAQDQAEAAEEAAWVEMATAASKANVAHFEKALEKEPAVARTDTWGCSPLHFAAAGGSAVIAAELLKRGADVNVRDASEETPLHFAARAGHAPICELLLGAGANIDAVNVQDMTPFVLAGHANQEPACHLLADHGAGVAGMLDTQLPPLVVSQLVRKMFGA